MPTDIARKYTMLLAKEIVRLKPQPGTMPADLRVIREVLQAKFADPRFASALVNDLIASKKVTLQVR